MNAVVTLNAHVLLWRVASAEWPVSSLWPSELTRRSPVIRRPIACEPSGCALAWNRHETLWPRNMSTHQRATDPKGHERSLDLSHLRRDVRTALELAIVALAPGDLVDRLAVSAGLFEGLSELPTDSAPVIALVPKLVTRTRSTLADWQKWQREHLEKKIPRG